MNVEFPEVVLVPFNKGGTDYEVNLLVLDNTSLVDLLRHGLKQKLNDAYSGVAKSMAGEMQDAEKKANPGISKAALEAIKPSDADILEASKRLFEKTLAKLLEEGFRLGSGAGGAALTPVEEECRAIVSNMLQKQHGKGKAEAEKIARSWRDVVTGEADQEVILSTARRNVAQKEIPTISIALNV